MKPKIKKKYSIGRFNCDNGQISICGDWILINFMDRFADDNFLQVWNNIQSNKKTLSKLEAKKSIDKEGEINRLKGEIEGDTLFLSTWWKNNVTTVPKFDEEGILELSDELRSICPKEFKDDFSRVFPFVFLDYGPDIITRSNKLKKKVSNLKNNEKREEQKYPISLQDKLGESEGDSGICISI